MAVAFKTTRVNLPSLPNEKDPEPVERIVERHFIEQVNGVPGKDGRNGRDARPNQLHRLRVVYRRDAVSKNDFIRESVLPEDHEAATFCSGLQLNGDFTAPCVLRITLAHDIVDEAVVGQRVCLRKKGDAVVSTVAPPKLALRVRSSVTLVTLTMTIEAFDD